MRDRFDFGNHQPGMVFPRQTQDLPLSDLNWFRLSKLKREREAGFERLTVCERDVFVAGNGFHEFIDPIESTPVSIDHEVTYCELSARRRAEP